jgi:tetratricopeptide (TPR) repeat protein
MILPAVVSRAVWSVTIVATLLVLINGLASAQVRTCGVDDSTCLESIYASQCAESGASAETCRTWAAELQSHRSVTPTTAIGLALGLTYFRLSETAASEEDASAYRDRARAVFLEVVAADPSAGDGYLMLSVIESDPIERRIGWLRRAVEVDPGRLTVRSLVNELMRLGTLEGILEAIVVADAAYINTGVGRDKWRDATQAWYLRTLTVEQYPEAVDPASAASFAERVRRESGWDDAAQIAAQPSRRPAAVKDALEILCALTGIFGDDVCIRGIEEAVLAATRFPSEPDARILGDAAAAGMKIAPRGGGIVEGSYSRTPLFEHWLDELLREELDSPAVLDALATISRNRERRLQARRDLVARNPADSEAWLELGKIHFDESRWEEALAPLEIARELSSGDDRFLIESYLRQAIYEIEAAAAKE